MKFSIFSKFEMAGGSEFRCVEIANGIEKFSEHSSLILAEKGLPSKLFPYINSNVRVIENCLSSPEYFYESDYIIVVNTDVREFSTIDYWTGKSARHAVKFEIDKLKKMFFQEVLAVQFPNFIPRKRSMKSVFSFSGFPMI